jgi:hypothetical protein
VADHDDRQQGGETDEFDIEWPCLGHLGRGERLPEGWYVGSHELFGVRSEQWSVGAV